MNCKDGLYIADKLDSDGDLQIFTNNDYITWLTKDDAIEIIKHLVKVFEIEDKELE